MGFNEESMKAADDADSARQKEMDAIARRGRIDAAQAVRQWCSRVGAGQPEDLATRAYFVDPNASHDNDTVRVTITWTLEGNGYWGNFVDYNLESVHITIGDVETLISTSTTRPEEVRARVGRALGREPQAKLPSSEAANGPEPTPAPKPAYRAPEPKPQLEIDEEAFVREAIAAFAEVWERLFDSPPYVPYPKQGELSAEPIRYLNGEATVRIVMRDNRGQISVMGDYCTRRPVDGQRGWNHRATWSAPAGL